MAKKTPEEVSSRVQPPAMRRVVQYSRPRAADPRFDRACGSFSDASFRVSYGFVGDIQAEERRMAAREAQRAPAGPRGDAVRRLAQRLGDMSAARAAEDERARLRREVVRREASLVASGTKRPYYVRDSEIRRQAEELAIQRAVGSRTGAAAERAAESLLEKKRRRRASRLKRHLPAQ